ncbi:hypothetical protein GCM10017673_56400 [Streptosporangium violaceochromogenes]|nr:hypothetical protein GCM10017673_56400 [Streptosporangium violaceochromogenes]
MPKTRAALLGIVVVALAAGCSGEPTAQPAPATTAPEAATPSTEAPNAGPTAQTLPIGQRQTLNDADSTGTVTALRIQQPLKSQNPPERAGYEFAGVEILKCFKTITTENGITVGWGPWTLSYKDGTVIEPPSSWSAEDFSVPLYPRDKPVRPGRCVRGWIPFEVPKGSRASSVMYTLEATDTTSDVQVEWTIR